MGVQNTTLLSGATVAATGGTAQNFTPDGVFIQNGIHVADAGNASFITRESIAFRTKNPVLVNGVYTKGKRWITLTVPRVLASGQTAFDLVRIEIEIHPETSAADAAIMFGKASQLFFDTDVASFLSTGSLA